MNETETRRKKIDPKLYSVGWEAVPQSEILCEQRAYEFAPGRVSVSKNSKPKKADYVLKYKDQRLAVIEAKSDERSVNEGTDQAKLYAKLLNIRFAYATNGDKIRFFDMGVGPDHKGYSESDVDKFHSPMELWQMTFPDQNPWRDKFRLTPFYRDENGRAPRYYQENAINAVLDAVAKKQNRILLTMATGTGKTFTAFQICWKLHTARWTASGADNTPRILFITDRNTLADQARNDFSGFSDDIVERITPKLLSRKKHSVPKGHSLYFTIFQTLMLEDKTGKPCYMQYSPEFFDFIIIDECHRGGANDEGRWRELMEYFSPAYQLGLTATPRRVVNANTYQYFGEPVYSYSLRQGIEDGFLTPYRVEISMSNIDEYEYTSDDTVIKGEVDDEKTYTEQDFDTENIKIDDRDEYRVKELLQKINPDDKTIVFCRRQQHALFIRDLINQHSKHPHPDYCKRVTAEDGDEGESVLKEFQDNDKTIPTILTTSQKLSTGVDARNVRNIVLLRRVENMVEFKQIIGRGTRLFDNKYYFTIYDFVGACKKFNDPEWDGDPICPTCGNWPCSCQKGGGGTIKDPLPCEVCGHYPCVCPCPECGNDPCTCDGGGGNKKKTVVIKLGDKSKKRLFTRWEEKIQYFDRLITIQELVNELFGQRPKFFKKHEDLRAQWQNPKTREALVSQLAQEGFEEDKLRVVARLSNMENCDLFDVLEYLLYHTTPLERKHRVELVRKQYMDTLDSSQKDFINYIAVKYETNGYHELSMENLPKFITQKYGSVADASNTLLMSAAEIKTLYLDFQRELYQIDGRGYASAAEPSTPFGL